MPKETRKIYRGVRIDDLVYTDGMEDELEAVLSSEQNKRLTEKGVIEGFATKTKPVERENEKAK